MTINLDDLIRRQAAILADINRLNDGEVESFANSPLPEDAVPSEIKKARKLLRGLVRTWNVGGDDLKITSRGTDHPGIVASPPGFFVIDLLPLPEGGFDHEQVIRIPLVAWEIDGGGYATPIVPCSPMTERWAVLTPAGYVIVDECTRLGCGPQITLKDWIKSEIEWVEVSFDFWTASQTAFEYSGPLPRAIWFMMAGRPDWKGTLEEMLEALSKFRDQTDATRWPSRSTALAAVLDAEALEAEVLRKARAAGIPEQTLEQISGVHHIACAPDWPSSSASLAEALEELRPVLTGVGLRIDQIDDGRLLIARVSDEGSNNGPFLLPR